MTDAGDITNELGEEVVTDQRRGEYWIPGVTDVTDYPTVDRFDPIPDPTIQQQD